MARGELQDSSRLLLVSHERHHDFRTGGVPAGASPDELFQWACEQRRKYAAGEVPPKQPKLLQKATDTEAAVVTESDTDTDGLPEGGHPSP